MHSLSYCSAGCSFGSIEEEINIPYILLSDEETNRRETKSRRLKNSEVPKMKSLKYFFIVSLFPLVIFPQNNKENQNETNVDKVAKRLTFLSAYSYDDWKKSPNLSGGIVIESDLKSINYDDSKWGTLSLDQHVTDDSCWLRKTIVLPKQFLGTPIKGKVKLLLSVDDYGYLWINGGSKGHILFRCNILIVHQTNVKLSMK